MLRSVSVALGCAAFLTGHCARAQTADKPQPTGIMRWFDPSTAPFIPVPEIDVDPNSGTTLGLIPTWLLTDDQDQIRKIIAPDVIYNPNFGVGLRGRMYSFDSNDTQWSVVAGAKQHVEREFDYEYQTGRLRESAWSFTASAIYDRSGTSRFYGIGNGTLSSAETNYTLAQKYVQASIGWNVNHNFQLSYTARLRGLDVEGGALSHVPSIETKFGGLFGLGVGHEILNRFAVIYDTRDDTTVPSRGTQVTAYGGIANGYRVAGFDARQLWTPAPGNTLVAHAASRYMLGKSAVPFWTLSSLGGSDSIVGGTQPLRGFGSGRFYDRNSLSLNAEYRKQVLAMNAIGTYIKIEVTPFLDAGEVFAESRENPLSRLHKVGGVGFRGIASPFVVGFVDIGYGSEGAAVFTGINYPF